MTAEWLMKYRPSSEIIQDKCTSGCPVLDSFLHGGLPCGLLIELSGEHARKLVVWVKVQIVARWNCPVRFAPPSTC